MTASCRPCESNFHDHCKDVDPGTPCACQRCPDEDHIRRLRQRILKTRQRLRAAEAELEALTGEHLPEELPDEDPLAAYRRPGDHSLGRRRLELATKEMYGT